tara:strand:+ start:57704 stop:58402 length:699 start_codon:yes stop_codon:yes gene_type:complete
MSASSFSISVIVPSKNDERIFLSFYDDIKNYFIEKNWDYEILFVSNGSSQENLKFIRKIKDKNFIHLNLKQSGKGLAIKFGIEQSKYKNVLFMDADCSVAINELDNFVINNRLKNSVLIGTRRTGESVNKGTPILRRVSGTIYLLLVKMLFGLNLTDTQCGFKVFEKSLYESLDYIKNDNFSFDIELLVKFSKKNTIVEIPVKYVHNNDSKVSLFKDSFFMFYDLIMLKLKY